MQKVHVLILLALALLIAGCAAPPRLLGDKIEECSFDGQKIKSSQSVALGVVLNVSPGRCSGLAAEGDNISLSVALPRYNCGERFSTGALKIWAVGCDEPVGTLLAKGLVDMAKGERKPPECRKIACTAQKIAFDEKNGLLNVTALCNQKLADAGNLYSVYGEIPVEYKPRECAEISPNYRNCTSEGEAERCTSEFGIAATKRI